MIQNRKILEEWEKNYQKKSVPDFKRNLAILEAMYQEAHALHVFPLQDPLEGLDVKIRIAEAINV